MRIKNNSCQIEKKVHNVAGMCPELMIIRKSIVLQHELLHVAAYRRKAETQKSQFWKILDPKNLSILCKEPLEYKRTFP